MSDRKDKTLLIIGCGYLGGFLVDHAHDVYQNTVAIVRSSKRLEGLQNKLAKVHVVDIFAEKVSYDSLLCGLPYDAVFMIPPSAIGRDVTEVSAAMDKTVKELDTDQCSTALLISSTGIYGNPEKEVVTAETTPEPDGIRGERLAAIENRWLAAGEHFRVLRLAGIYGPERIIGQRPLMHGEVIGGRPEAWLNLIHAQDAAALSIKCLSPDAAKIELGSDNNPVKRKDYYGYVARQFGYPVVRFADEAAQHEPSYPVRTSNGKKCDPASTYRRLRWSPRFENYATGVSASISITPAHRE